MVLRLWHADNVVFLRCPEVPGGRSRRILGSVAAEVERCLAKTSLRGERAVGDALEGRARHGGASRARSRCGGIASELRELQEHVAEHDGPAGRAMMMCEAVGR